jgi:GDPmannose 4,6-dehydratase
MSITGATAGVAIVTGAAGQDGYFLTERLLREGWTVHATARHLTAGDFASLALAHTSRLHTHEVDLQHAEPIRDLLIDVQPDEFYNLAGASSVSRSFSNPLYTWQTNAEAVVHLLEWIRTSSPRTRFYQASSTDMFGAPGESALHNEASALQPQSPYASAKAAAHLLCRSYREVYGLRIACGILSNHESHRRPASFLSRKVVDHVVKLKQSPPDETLAIPPLVMGNLRIRRDWGFAPEYVEGMCRILRQIKVRADQTGTAISDDGSNYRDYVLGTGTTHGVWELVDRAFALAGFELDWQMDGDDPAAWQARFRGSGSKAVIVDPDLLRTAEPWDIRVDPSRARNELGWSPQQGLDGFLTDMLDRHAGNLAGLEQ